MKYFSGIMREFSDVVSAGIEGMASHPLKAKELSNDPLIGVGCYIARGRMLGTGKNSVIYSTGDGRCFVSRARYAAIRDRKRATDNWPFIDGQSLYGRSEIRPPALQIRIGGLRHARVPRKGEPTFSLISLPAGETLHRNRALTALQTPHQLLWSGNRSCSI